VAWESVASFVQKARLFDCGRADDDVIDAGVEVLLDGIEIANAAAELHRNIAINLSQDAFDRSKVLRLAGKRAIQIHQMQTTRAFIQPVFGHRGRVFGENGGVFHQALTQANAVAVFEINRRNNQHDKDSSEQ